MERLRKRRVLSTKKTKKGRFNRIFSAAGLSVGAVILVYLTVYVVRTMDLRALLRQVRPLWLVGAALCIPVSESIDALIFYGMGRSAGCPVRLAGCFDATFIGEFYYKLGPAGAPVQLKLMYDAGMPATNTASIYIWKMVANIMLYTIFGVVALIYHLVFRHASLSGGVLVGMIFSIALCLFGCAMALLMAVRPAPLLRLIRRILTALSRKVKYLGREGKLDAAMRKVEEFAGQLSSLKGNTRLFAWLYVGMALELAALFSVPYFLYHGLGLQGESFLGMFLLQAMVMMISRLVMLPGNVGGAEGSFYLFMGPVFGEHLAVGLVLWRLTAFLEVMLLGGVWSVIRFAKRSVAGRKEHPA